MSDIQTLSTGPELDLLVAEKVMGLSAGLCPSEDLEVVDGGMGCPECQFCSLVKYHEAHQVVLKKYSSSLLSAWEVVAKVLEILGPVAWWECRGPRGVFFKFHVPEGEVGAPGRDLPEAICRAALKAVQR